MILYILLGIIAVGVLLLSEPGKKIVNSTFSALWILLITTGFIYLGMWLWSILYENKDKIGSGIESTVPTILIIVSLIWLGKKIKNNNNKPDEELNWLGRFIKHTKSGMMALYVVLILLGAATISAFVS